MLCALGLGVGCEQTPRTDGFVSGDGTGNASAGNSTSSGSPTSTTSGPSGSTSTSSEPPSSSTASTDPTDPTDPEVQYDVGAPEKPWEPKNDLPETCDAIAKLPATSVGCEFFGVDVPGGGAAPYGISIGNPSSQQALVRIEDRRGPDGALREITTVAIEPGESRLIEVNGQYADGTGGILLGEDHGFYPDQPFAGELQAFEHAAFHVVSDIPVTAMQIAPVGGGPSAVAEASLLLPVNALDTTYRTIGYPSSVGQIGESQSWNLVVATQDDTTVSTPTGDVTLGALDVLYVVPGADSSGTFITADAPVALFSGGICVNVGGQYCDHIEEQVFPLSAWGREYVGSRHPVRVPEINPNPPEDVVWRAYGAVDGTVITLDPPHEELGDQVEVGAGEWVEFRSKYDFVASSDSPFLLVQYMVGCRSVMPLGSNCSSWTVASGDPYMAQMVPVEQWIARSPFLTDTSYPRDFVVIARHQGAEVRLACMGKIDDDRFHRVGSSTFEVARIDLDIGGNGGEGDCVDGAQLVESEGPVGILVGGVDYASSYGYPGGMFINANWEPQG